MLPVCYDPYSGTLGKFTRSEIFELEIVLDIAQQVNANIIGIWPNPTKNVPVEASLKTLSANLCKMCPILTENNLQITIEFEKGCPVDNYRDGIAFIQNTQLPVHLTCDTYHLFNDNADPYK